MDPTLRQLRVFRAVAEERSFSGAAERLRTAQSNLSRIIAELERHLGCPLLVRTTRSVTLTAEGEALLDVARHVLEVHAHEVARFAEIVAGTTGTARIAALPSVALAVLPVYYERMLVEHPGIQVDLREGAADDITELLLDDEVHVAIGLESDDEDRIASERFISDHFVALVSERSALARREEVSWRELAAHPYIALSSQTSVRQLADATFRALGVQPHAPIHVANTASVAGLVARDLGVSALPALALGLFDYPGLVRIPLVEPRVTRELRILSRRDLPLSPIGRRALDTLRRLRDEEATLPVGASWTTADAS